MRDQRFIEEITERLNDAVLVEGQLAEILMILTEHITDVESQVELMGGVVEHLIDGKFDNVHLVDPVA